MDSDFERKVEGSRGLELEANTSRKDIWEKVDEERTSERRYRGLDDISTR